MGVFARLLGRSKATPEASDATAEAGTEPDGAEVARTESAEAAEAQEAGAADAADANDAAGNGHEDVTVRPEAGTDGASEGAGIPRQQSAEEVAAGETGEGARR
ncbi:hypothetical protein ACF073_32590 [Streptomyces sp. NPDC015171]|uniref:hypothetical protein n=1 Tax=Streptomyces sp. NPDC015171 TaxID=3364945 RepID=UPI0036FCCC03